ncbi:MAG TPA: hypothetical protein VGL68_05685 [Solirubrobacteraceae bacterium]|jgi:hypothetical protein
MPNEEPPIEPVAGASASEHAASAERSAATTHETAVQAPALAYRPEEEGDGWLDEPEELPSRPRRRLLAPVPIALLLVLLTACGFIGGVLVEKGQGNSDSSTAGAGASALASRFAALRGGGIGGGAKAGASDGSSGAGSRFGGSGIAGASGTGTGATVGQVAYIRRSTLYVTTAEGNTVKVDTSPASTVTKTITSDVSSIHPGETVLVTGAAGTNGAVRAESIRVGADGGGGLAALFGRSGTGSSRGTGTGSGGGGGGGGEPALFGKGG